jgi:glucose-1-phosphate thymidylyltransferase
VNALLLAGGYATRLRPLTDRLAKPLLPVGGRPMVDWILERIQSVPQVERVHLVTNAVYAGDFLRWAAAGRDVTVHDDGTTSNDDRLGAVGDIQFAVDEGDLAGDDLLVIAADNLFQFSLEALLGFWERKGGSAVAVHRLADPPRASLSGVVERAADDRVIGLEEKPEAPASDLVSTATYLFSAGHLALVRRYLDEGNLPDPPGRFLVWLYPREPLYGFRFAEEWIDIGDPGQLLEADNRYRARLGLPERDAYTPELLTT